MNGVKFMIAKSDIMSELKEFELAVEVMFDKTKEQLTKIVNTNNTIKEKISGIYAQQRKLNEDINEIKMLVNQQTENQVNMYYAGMTNEDKEKSETLKKQETEAKNDGSHANLSDNELPTTIYPLGVETIVFDDSDNFVHYQIESSLIMTVERSTSERYPKYFVIVRIKNSYDVPMDYIDQISISKQTYEYIVENVLEKRLYWLTKQTTK